MKNIYKIWNTIKSRRKAANLILQCPSTDRPLHEDFFMPRFMRFRHTGSVLDFGAGIGRNSFLLASRCEELWAYDFPNMLKMLEEDFRFKNFNNITTSSDWEVVSNKKFDAIVCCISLQHLTKEDCIKYLADFAKMTNDLYVNTRPYLDFNGGLIYPLLVDKWTISRIYGKTTEDQIQKFTKSAEQFFVHLNRRIE